MNGASMWTVAAACAVLSAVAVAKRADAGVSARLVYARASDAASCPDEGALRNAVAARLGYDPFFPWAKETVVVQVWREAGRFQARLQLVDSAGLAHGTRGLSSAESSCNELFDAAALAISIAMDSLPKDTSTSVPASAPEAAPEPGPAPAPAPVPEPSAALVAAHARDPAPETPPSRSPRVVLGVDALASVGYEPALAPGLAVSTGIRAASFSGSVELRADVPTSTTSASGVGRVEARTIQAAALPCVHFAGGLFLCGVAGVGRLYAKSDGITNPTSASGVFATAGARIGLDWPVSARFSLRADLDARVDMRRATLLVSERPAWTAPLVAGAAAIGLAVYFP